MLSYQHHYHAGNLADVHKHSTLAWVLDYLTRKSKPLTYIETHAGRGLYDLTDDAAQKTGEAAQGIGRVAHWFGADHPYSRVLIKTRAADGPDAYPGSPLIAAQSLRGTDTLHLAEMHPGEYQKLDLALSPYAATCHGRDGFELAYSLCPPTPRRGVLLIDPSYEIKTEYTDIPRHIAKLHKAWNVGVILLWYPILTNDVQKQMVLTLRRTHPDALCHEVTFPPARPGHGMIGSGLFVLNPPYGLSSELSNLSNHFATLKGA